MYNLYVNVQGSRSYTIHFMVLCSMALLRQYMPPTAKWYFIPGRLSPAFFLTLLGEPHTDPDLSMDTTRQSMYSQHTIPSQMPCTRQGTWMYIYTVEPPIREPPIREPPIREPPIREHNNKIRSDVQNTVL